MNRIYCAIGKITEVTQLIELDLYDVCENSEIIKEFSRHAKMTRVDLKQIEEDANYLRNKMESMTFGNLITIIRESKSLNYDEITGLKTLLEKRNYFTHEYFKYTKFGINPKEEFIVEEFEAIKQYLRKLQKMLSKLEMIKSSQVERLKYLKQKNNL